MKEQRNNSRKTVIKRSSEAFKEPYTDFSNKAREIEQEPYINYNDLSVKERHELQGLVYKNYVQLVRFECSGASTEEIEEFKKCVFSNSTYRKNWDTGPNYYLYIMYSSYNLKISYWLKRTKELISVYNLEDKRQQIIGEIALSKNPIIFKISQQIKDRGLVPCIFKYSNLDDILQAIQNKQLVEDIDIAQKVKEPLFRFITTDNPVLSSQVSEVIHAVYSEGYKEAKIITPRVRDMGTKKLKENADDFAKTMYDIIKNLQPEEKTLSYRETVKTLNEKNIPSYRGEKWHVNTVQQLQKRWKELGLTPDDNKKPEPK